MPDDYNLRLSLRYGLNPTQGNARLSCEQGSLPLQVLAGSPSYINILDALRGWKLVRELQRRFGRAAAASFKHVNPAGVGLSGALSPDFPKVHFLEDVKTSPLSQAYLRARQADRISSYGDFAALSDVVDVETASILGKVASDGVIAPGFEPEALEILKQKRQGRFLVLAIDSAFEPKKQEIRTEFGLNLVQDADDSEVPDPSEAVCVSKGSEVPDMMRADLLLATIVARHTQSNAVVLASGGQTIGIGAGQQSRISATELACNKADTYRLLFHPAIQNVRLKDGLTRIEKMNVIDNLINFNLLSDNAKQNALTQVIGSFVPLSLADRQVWLSKQEPTALASDAFIPFRDNVDRAAQSGVTHIIQTGGSVRDADVTEAANEAAIVMLHNRRRYFLH